VTELSYRPAIGGLTGLSVAVFGGTPIPGREIAEADLTATARGLESSGAVGLADGDLRFRHLLVGKERSGARRGPASSTP
jgi:hypothetical protein